MQPKTTTMPMIANIETYPREDADCGDAPVAPVALASSTGCDGFIWVRSDSSWSLECAITWSTAALTGKRSPHQATSDWLSCDQMCSAMAATLTGLDDCSIAKNSFLPQRPRKSSMLKL